MIKMKISLHPGRLAVRYKFSSLREKYHLFGYMSTLGCLWQELSNKLNERIRG